jgi:glycosyltransferase involved in cell wall biosynthesis
VCVVEPARERAPGTRTHDGALRAVVVANIIPNKGVLPLLQALRSQLEVCSPEVSSSLLRVHIVGRRETDPEYTRACERELATSGALAACVQLVGTASYESLLGELGAAHVLLSASRVESYGMAIADARAAGCVVLARRGGHVEHLVSTEAGGALVDDDDALVTLLLGLVADRQSLAIRLALAARHKPPARGWDDVAREVQAAHAAGFALRVSGA